MGDSLFLLPLVPPSLKAAREGRLRAALVPHVPCRRCDDRGVVVRGGATKPCTRCYRMPPSFESVVYAAEDFWVLQAPGEAPCPRYEVHGKRGDPRLVHGCRARALDGNRFAQQLNPGLTGVLGRSRAKRWTARYAYRRGEVRMVTAAEVTVDMARAAGIIDDGLLFFGPEDRDGNGLALVREVLLDGRRDRAPLFRWMELTEVPHPAVGGHCDDCPAARYAAAR